MTDKKKHFREEIRCGHCGNTAPMEVTASLSHVESNRGSRDEIPWEGGPVHELLVCPACHDVTLRRYYWHDALEPEDVHPAIVYPRGAGVPLGLPHAIQREFEAALRVRTVSPNTYGVLLGRLLELVCDDRGAVKSGIGTRLKSLSDRSEIPSKLVDMAQRLQDLRNVGAHAWVGDLTSAEIPILDSVCRAILEHVYSAPHLVEQAEERIKKVKKRRGTQRRASNRKGTN